LSHRPEFYVDLLQAVVYEVAQRGQGVILGHGSQILLRDFQCALHVHIHASESFRIAHLMAQQGLSREPAAKLIHRSDSERKGFLRFAFHMDWNDPSLYDIIINRDKLGTDLAAKLILEAAQSQEIKDCSLTALETMERLALSRRVQAAILKSDFSTNVFHIDVLERSIVHITGFTHDRGEISRLLETVKGVPGVSEVRSEIAFVPLAAE
jgi:hypothetical protein